MNLHHNVWKSLKKSLFVASSNRISSGTNKARRRFKGTTIVFGAKKGGIFCRFSNSMTRSYSRFQTVGIATARNGSSMIFTLLVAIVYLLVTRRIIRFIQLLPNNRWKGGVVKVVYHCTTTTYGWGGQTDDDTALFFLTRDLGMRARNSTNAVQNSHHELFYEARLASVA